jgi:IclR family pca regulon transcriptional regulator
VTEVAPGPADDTAGGGEAASAAPPRSRDFVQSVDRALAIIRTFGPQTPAQTVTEIARATGLTRAAARRFLLTLSELGYVASDGRQFSLTPRVLELGYAYLSSLTLPEVALPHIERLVAEVEDSSEVSILDGDDVVYVAKVTGPAIMTAAVNVGARMPAAATSMGRVLLAALPDDELDAYLARVTLEAHLPTTVTDPAELRELLVCTRRGGYALVEGELEEGLLAVSVPIHDRSGRTVAAINVSTHVARRTRAEAETVLLPALRRAAAAIEADLAR